MKLRGAILVAAGLAAGAAAEPWPAWRGPRGDGTSRETGIPLRWSEGENVLWKVAVPGRGHSSPVVWGERLFVTSCDERRQERLLLCYGTAEGKLLWRRVVLRSPLERKNRLNSYASSTPATDGKRVWVTFMAWPSREIHVACYDADGKPLWRTSPGKLYSMHGFCSSLLPYRDLIILNADQDAKAYIVAFDAATGAERWRIDRPNRTRSYCPPVVFDLAGRKQLVLSGSKCVASYDPDTGRPLWIIDGPTEQFCASLVHTRGILCCTGGYPTLHIIGIDPSGRGNVTDTHVRWHVRENPSYVPSPIAAGGDFYVVSDKGVLSCLDALTGKYLWSHRLGRHHSASPVAADGRLYFPDDDGRTWVVRPGATFQLLATNALEEKIFASPAVSGGRIYIRALRQLYCIGRPAPAPAGK